MNTRKWRNNPTRDSDEVELVAAFWNIGAVYPRESGVSSWRRVDWVAAQKYLQWLVVVARLFVSGMTRMLRRIVGLLFVCLCLQIGCRRGDSGSRGVVLLKYNPGSESTEQREKGFLETLSKEYPGIKVISSDQYAGTTPESALDKATDVLNKYRGRVTGVFAVCEPNATGIVGSAGKHGAGRQSKSGCV